MSHRRLFHSLYVHVPFCREKCAYCGFYSFPAGNAEQYQTEKLYLERLGEEFSARQQDHAPLRSVYIGGGTPTALSPESMHKLLSLVFDYFHVSSSAEITVESNPESLSTEKIAILSTHHVNRLSIGIQSFHGSLRHAMGRRGHLDGLEEKLLQCREKGLDILNFDLIYGIPGQSIRQWQEDLQKALSYPVSHVSCYALTLEENIALTNQEPVLPSEEDELAMWDKADAVLGESGFRRYEISNFAYPGRECRHNLDVWHGGTYLGCGPAACSFDGTTRFCNAADFQSWLNRTPPVVDEVDPPTRAAEILAFGLRTAEGWCRPDFYKLTGYDFWSHFQDKLAHLQAMGLVEAQGDHLFPTEKGFRFADTLARELL